MSDPRYPGSPPDPYDPNRPTPQQPTDPAWQPQQPTDPAWQPQQPTDPAWQPQSQWQPQQPWQAQQPPPAKKRRNWLGTAIVVGIVAALVIGFVVFRDRLPSNVAELAVGECFNEPEDTSEAISDVPRQPCNEPHDGEVFAVFRHTAASGVAYPSSLEFQDFVSDECLPKVQAYTGRTLAEIDSAGISYGFYYPTPSGWAEGDRGISCYLKRADGTKLTGSVRAATPASVAPGAPGTPGAPASP